MMLKVANSKDEFIRCHKMCRRERERGLGTMGWERGSESGPGTWGPQNYRR